MLPLKLWDSLQDPVDAPQSGIPPSSDWECNSNVFGLGSSHLLIAVVTRLVTIYGKKQGKTFPGKKFVSLLINTPQPNMKATSWFPSASTKPWSISIFRFREASGGARASLKEANFWWTDNWMLPRSGRDSWSLWWVSSQKCSQKSCCLDGLEIHSNWGEKYKL